MGVGEEKGVSRDCGFKRFRRASAVTAGGTALTVPRRRRALSFRFRSPLRLSSTYVSSASTIPLTFSGAASRDR